jgi:hypothetical protein
MAELKLCATKKGYSFFCQKNIFSRAKGHAVVVSLAGT